MTEIEKKELIKRALEMRNFSYTPYSHYNVGAALLAANGTIYTGCNIENASFTPSNCAERTAFFKAVSEGVKEFNAIAIVGGPSDAIELEYCPPCGVCRQVMSEFCKDDFIVICAKSVDEYMEYTLPEILPARFGPKDLLG
ncbi:cytidine deaminase [Butyrivibrio sp. YAB3001]|uniref:cytidine deaminase n=1 Tax=Butyrivibrio sp. YAB3001 TaxID=1520812 RepID=UPI0008F642FC|nr:cytidine deaminase [Butyrivibrio sp. YAB3001]SFB68684.1 cytidine deaminase [Butyrivibrio sp. YAB3001]